MAGEAIRGTFGGNQTLHGISLIHYNYCGMVKFSWTNKDDENIEFHTHCFVRKTDERDRQVVVMCKTDSKFDKHPYWTGTIQVWAAGEGYVHDANWTSTSRWLDDYMMYKYEHHFDQKSRKWVKAPAELIKNWQEENKREDTARWKFGTVTQAAGKILALPVDETPATPSNGRITFDDNFVPSGSVIRRNKT